VGRQRPTISTKENKMEKTETLNEFLLFDTPKDMKDLMARIECLNGSERGIATLFAFMAFNLAVKIAKEN
jgi:hypothetical protein